MKILNKLACFLVAASLLPFLSGCLPIILAAGYGASYIARTPEALDKFNAWLVDLDKTIQKKFNKTYNESETEKHFAYKPGQGLVIALIGCEIHPKEVKPGEEVTATIQYAIMGATEETGVEVEENKTLWFGDEQAATLANEKVSRKNGTWESVVTFKVPDKVQAGQYRLRQSISSNDKMFQSYDSFEIAAN